MTVEIPPSVLRAWGKVLHPASSINPLVWLVTQGETRLILKKRPASFKPDFQQGLLTTLVQRHIPAVPAIPTLAGTTTHFLSDDHWSLYPHIPGNTALLSSMPLSEARALGTTLAELHLALESIPASHHVSELLLPGNIVEGCPRGLIHRDFHPRNILINESKVCAVLDFDLVCRGPLVFDLAYLAASLLADSWLNTDARESFGPVLGEITFAYSRKRALTAREVESFPFVCEEIEQMFVQLGRDCANQMMELSAQEIKTWFFLHRTEISNSLKRVRATST